MSYRLSLSDAAKRDFDRLPTVVQKQVDRYLDVLSDDPRPPKFKPLTEKELKGSCRVHVGRDYCIGYRIDDATRQVFVWLIGHRATFYEVAKRRLQSRKS